MTQATQQLSSTFDHLGSIWGEYSYHFKEIPSTEEPWQAQLWVWHCWFSRALITVDSPGGTLKLVRPTPTRDSTELGWKITGLKRKWWPVKAEVTRGLGNFQKQGHQRRYLILPIIQESLVSLSFHLVGWTNPGAPWWPSLSSLGMYSRWQHHYLCLFLSHPSLASWFPWVSRTQH